MGTQILKMNGRVPAVIAADRGSGGGEVLPHLAEADVQDFAVEGAQTLEPMINEILSWIDDQDGFDTVSRGLLDSFIRAIPGGLADSLYAAILHAAGAGWESIRAEIPELKARAGDSLAVVAADVPAPAEALRNLRQRTPVPKEIFDAITSDMRAKAFTVAGWTSATMLKDVQSSLEKALADGQSFGTWKSGIRDTLDKHGWTEQSANHLELIYSNNMKNAYSAQRWAGFQAAKILRPYLQKKTQKDDRVREGHKQYHDFVAHIDDPIWLSLAGPLGHACRCYEVSLSARQVEAGGFKIHEGFTDKSGIDKGWDYNPALGATTDLMKYVYDTFDPQKLFTWEDFPQLSDTPTRITPRPQVPPPPATLRKRDLSDDQIKDLYRDDFKAHAGITADRPAPVQPDPMGTGAQFHVGMFEHAISKNFARGRFGRLAVDAVADPDEVWLTWITDRDGKSVPRRRYLKVYESDDKISNMLTVVEEQSGAFPGVTYIPMKRKRDWLKQRVGILLYVAEVIQ